MKLAIACLVAAAFALCGIMAAYATSQPPRRLTPNNLAEQPHRIAISADDSGGGKRFYVIISGKTPKPPLEVEWGCLSVYDGERLLCGCRLHAQQDESQVVFEFVVAPTVLEKSRFSFSAATATPEQRKNMPAGAGWENYELALQSFVDHGVGKANGDIK